MWDELQAIEKKIDTLRERVMRAVQPAPASARELTTIVSQEISCREDDLTERTATFYNGSGDSYVIHRLSVTVSIDGSEPEQRVFLDRYAFGYMRSGFEVTDDPLSSRPKPVGPFDFLWNYTISSRQALYSRQAVGSTVFNGLERSQAFDLYEPLILKPVDSIEFRLRPLAYALPGTPGKDPLRNYFVNFIAVGYRRPL